MTEPEINEGEHYEIGGTFEFSLFDKDQQDDHLNDFSQRITYQLWDLDFIDNLQKSGKGHKFTHQFTEDDHGDGHVRFFYDSDDNGDWDYILTDEAGMDSKDFYVQNTEVYKFKTIVSPLLLIDKSYMELFYTQVARYILRKDSQDDYRACVEFKVDTYGSFNISSERPDPADSLVKHRLHGQESEHVTLLSDLGSSLNNDIVPRGEGGKPILGHCIDSDIKQILINFSEASSKTFAHEVGHGVGLEHDEESRTNSEIMYKFRDGHKRELLEEDVDNYEKGL